MNLLTKTNIVNGNIIQAADVYQMVDAFTYQVAYDILMSGSLTIGSGSNLPNIKLYIAGGNTANAKIEGGVSASSFTGSFLGDGTGITGVVSASYSVTASYANFAQNAGTASVANNISGAAGFIPVFNSATSLGSSLIFQSGSSILLNNGSGPTPFTFDIGGSGRFTSNLTVSGSIFVSQSLFVSGNISIPSSSLTQGVIYQNGVPFINTYYGGGSGSNNIYIGSGSGNFTSINAANNIAIGFNTLKSITGGNGNIVIGVNAGITLTSATANTLIGTNVGTLLTTGNTNTALGAGAAQNLSTGFENTLIGGNAGFGLTTGIRNTFIGVGAGRVASTATNNIVITCNANATQLGITTGTGNVIINPFNLNVTSGNNNSILGNGAGFNINQGNNNTFIGFNAGAGFNSASLNTAIGFGAASAISSSVTGSVLGPLVTNVTVIVNDVAGTLTQNLTSSNIFVYGLNQNVLLNKVTDNGFKFQMSGSQSIIANSGSIGFSIVPNSGFGGIFATSDGNLWFGTNQGFIGRGTATGQNPTSLSPFIILPGAGGNIPGRFIPNDATHGWLFSNSINGAVGVNDTHGVHIKDNEVSFAAANTQPTVIRFQYNFGINGGLRRPYFNLISDDLVPNSNTGSTFLIKAGNSGFSLPNNDGNPGDLYLGAGNFASGSALFNVRGGNLFISGGYGSGTGSAGSINFYTATALTASSSTPQTLSLLMSMSGSTVYTFGNMNVSSGSITINNTTITDLQTGSLLNVFGTFNTSITGSPVLATLAISDITSSASAKFMDLRLNGVSKFSISKDGNTGISGNVTISGTSNFASSWIGISNANARINWNGDGSISFNTGISTSSLAMTLTNTGSVVMTGNLFVSGNLNVSSSKTISVNVQTGSFNVPGRHVQYVFTGATASIWTLPSISTTLGAYYMIKSRGSANLTLQGSGSDQIFATSATGSIVLNTGNAAILVNDGTFWLIQ